MDPIDPLKASGLQGLPATDEVRLQVNKKIKEARMESVDGGSPMSDVSEFSAEAARLSKPQFEAFLEAARDEIANMDRNSETFLDDATQKLVSSAFEKKFGGRIKDDPGYPQMEARLKRVILNDPEARGMIEDFISLIDLEAQQRAV
ncbi:MAG: hypothetical protein EB084_01025 [Proteobacteria bacterium]|nr:hypothetical protein [Pseudomonadota bacterium]